MVTSGFGKLAADPTEQHQGVEIDMGVKQRYRQGRRHHRSPRRKAIFGNLHCFDGDCRPQRPPSVPCQEQAPPQPARSRNRGWAATTEPTPATPRQISKASQRLQINATSQLYCFLTPRDSTKTFWAPIATIKPARFPSPVKMRSFHFPLAGCSPSKSVISAKGASPSQPQGLLALPSKLDYKGELR